MIGPFASYGPLFSVGQAVLYRVGLNPQRLTTMSEARIPAAPTWGGMDYQPTGLGEAHTRIEALTYPHVIGGLDSLAILQQHHEAQDVVAYIRLGVSFLGRMMGQVRIRNLVVDETRLHPIDGIGRKVAVEIDLVYVGSTAAPPSLALPTLTTGAQ